MFNPLFAFGCRWVQTSSSEEPQENKKIKSATVGVGSLLFFFFFYRDSGYTRREYLLLFLCGPKLTRWRWFVFAGSTRSGMGRCDARSK